MGAICLADAGVPMLMLQLPGLVLMLLPVIAIEFWLCCRWIALPKRKILSGVALANVLSTFLGFPILWVMLVAIEMGVYYLLMLVEKVFYFESNSLLLSGMGFVLSTPWMGPYQDGWNWRIPTASLVLLIPTFFVSVYMERFFCAWYWKYEDRATLNRTFWKIHLASYVLLFAADVGLLVHGIATK